jgi:hypothetical protein
MYHTVETVTKSNRKTNKYKCTTLLKQLQNHRKRQNCYPTHKYFMTAHFSGWLGIGTSVKNDEVELVLLAHTSPLSEMVGSFKYFPHVGKMSTLTCKQAKSVVEIFFSETTGTKDIRNATCISLNTVCQ